MKRFVYLLPVVLLLLSSSLYGQVPVIQWQRLLGGSNGDYAGSVRPTADGGYIVAGTTEGADGDIVGFHGNVGIGDIWVVKLDGSGTVQWTKCLGGTYTETGADIQQTKDGGYIVAGSSASVDCGIPGNHGGLDIWLVKLSPAGDIQWQQMYGGSRNEYGVSLSMTPDGGYIIGGYTNSGDGQVSGYHDNGDPGNNFDWWIIKVDATGKFLWQKTLGGTGDDQVTSVKATPDGGCIAVGSTSSTDGDVTGYHGGVWDAWVVKLDGAGNMQWQKTYGGSQADQANSVQITADGNYIFAGYTASNDGDVSGNHQPTGAPDADFWVVKLSTTGAILWQKCYGGSFNEQAFCIQTMTDGGYIVGGTAESSDGDLTCNAGNTDDWIIKIDASGNLVWGKSIGGASPEQITAVQPLSDGSFIVAATTCSAELPGYHPAKAGGTGTCGDYWIVKLSAPMTTIPAPIVTISPASGKVCAGSPATFTASAQNTGVLPSYGWIRNGVSVGSGLTYTASDFKNGDVIAVNVTAGTAPCDNDPVQGAAVVIVSLNTSVLNPTINITSGSSFICSCAPATFQATVKNGGSAPDYEWMLNGVATGYTGSTWLSNGLLPTDVVTCQYTDLAGCVVGSPITSNAISLAAGTAGATTVTISGPPGAGCPGSPQTFAATPVNSGLVPIYQWQVNGNNAGTDSSGFTTHTLVNGDIVTCVVTPDPTFACAAGGNATSNAITISLGTGVAPSVQVTLPSGTICTGQTVTVGTISNNISGVESWQWELNGAPVGSNSPSLSQVFNNGDVVQCTITETGNSGACVLSNTATSSPFTVQVLNQATPSVSIVVTGNDACAGTPISFTETPADAGSAPSIAWLVNGVSQGDQTPTFSSSQLKDNDQIICSVTPGVGACSAAVVVSNAITAVIVPLPEVAIDPADTTIAYGRQVTLNAAVSADVTSYQWTPPGLLVDAQSLQPMTLPLTSDATLSLTVENGAQCTATATALIRIGRSLVMPGAFSPNGDGINDIFRIPPGTSLQLNEFMVFNRWGSKVFSTTDINQGWNGAVSGQPAAPGTYVYLITGTDAKGAVKKKGTVVLMR